MLKPAGSLQEVEARLDLARLEVGGDVVREQERERDQTQRATMPCSSHVARAEHAGPPGGRRRARAARALDRSQRIGGAYIRPPLVHRLLTPRGSPTGVFGPRLRSKLSP